MEFSYLIQIIQSDLYRYTKKINYGSLIKNLQENPGFKFTFYLRLCNYLFRGKKFQKYVLLRFFSIIYRRNIYKYGISIPYTTYIGCGFYIGHFGNIVIHKNVKIGRNCNISQGVTIGISNRGDKKGCPSIGDNVYIGPGAKIFGNILIGNNVAIGANSVVTKDIPDNAVVVGIPGKIISYKGSTGYINNTEYPEI